MVFISQLFSLELPLIQTHLSQRGHTTDKRHRPSLSLVQMTLSQFILKLS
jgi:hypothetical protein